MTAKLARNAGRRTASRSEARRVACLTAPRTATRGGWFTNRKGKAFSPCYATLLPAYTFPFPAPYPCRIPVFGLVSTQTGSRGSGFETGPKKMKRSKGRGRKIKISAGAGAIYVRGRYGLCAAVVRGWRQGVDTDVIWGRKSFSVSLDTASRLPVAKGLGANDRQVKSRECFGYGSRHFGY